MTHSYIIFKPHRADRRSPGAVKEQKLANYFGRKVAIDASMTIYQFAVRGLATLPDELFENFGAISQN